MRLTLCKKTVFSTAIDRTLKYFIRKTANKEVNSESRDHGERASFRIWFTRRDVKGRSRCVGSFASMLAKCRIYQGASPTIHCLLLPAKFFTVARTDV